jgi:hypothetical protein
MNKLTAVLTLMLIVTSCAQFTTSKSELAGLKNTADNVADEYVGCVVKNALSRASQAAVDTAALVQTAASQCQSELDSFESVQTEYLSAKAMLTKKPLQESVDALYKRSTTEATEALIAAAENQPAGRAPAMAGASATVAVSSATASAPAAAPAGWNAEQRIYLDCMEDQANKYAALNESAVAIADVAQSRCKSYMTGPGVAALEQEGRTLVMGAVFDAKLQGDVR